MSLQKIKSAKHVTYTDRYSKNPIINNLIKNKLETEMVAIKESFTNIIKRQQDAQQGRSSNRIGLRRNKSYSISQKQIQEAVQYNPIDRVDKFVENYVAARQIDSFLIPDFQLVEINKAREEHSGLNTKLIKTDAISLETPKNLKQFGKKVKQGTVQQYFPQVWLPDKPEITYLIQDKKEQLQTQSVRQQGWTKQEVIQRQLQKFTNRITGLKLDDQMNSMNSNKFSNFPLKSLSDKIQLKPAEYIPQKYHKNDYRLIETWLENTLQLIGKETKAPESRLNLVYSSYICVWKQLIRLTYIESCEKGLIIQKMLYSLLRLFWGIISEQQSLSRTQLKESQNDQLSLNKLMQERMEELNKRYITQCKQINSTQQLNHKLSKALISFEKVNHELVEQLEKITRQRKDLQKQFDTLNQSFFKTLQILYDKKLVEMDYLKQENLEDKNIPKSIKPISYKTFFIIDQYSKPKVLGRFKYQNDNEKKKPRFADEGLEQTFSEQLIKYNSRYGQNIRHIQNQLNRYWDKKQDDLQIKGIINSLVAQVKIKDECVGTTQFQKNQFSCQFPQNNEQYLQKILKQLRQELTSKFTAQKKLMESQMQQKQIVMQKWKQSSQQINQKYKNLQQVNSRLQENVKKLKESSNQLVQNIHQITVANEQHKSQISKLKMDLQNSQTDLQQAKIQKQKALRERTSMQMQLEREKQNNKMLVRNNLQMKEKVQKFDIRYSNILKSVKSVAPWLQKFMAQIDKPSEEVDFTILKSVSEKIQQYLSEYVVKDSSLFMTRVI